MAWLSTITIYLLVAGTAIVVYEIIRSILVTWFKRRQEKRVDKFLRANKIPHDAFRHTHRVVVKELALQDPGLVTEIAARAKADNKSPGEVRHQVRQWLDEIVPQFNLLAYYQVGYRLARIVAYSMYNVRLAENAWKKVRAKIPEDAAVVLVSNHRSNADFVVTGFMVSKSVQVSYAVGEWARVWPLEHLFKSFGSYFVRRGEKDPLYHRTLEAYLHLVTKQGVTQAMFPEGGLSRDGNLRPVKLGLLDMMTRAKLDSEFTKPLVFVPVGINFDRVIEDEVLVTESLGQHPYRRRGIGQKMARLGSLLWKVTIGIPIQIGRFFAKRLKKYGIVAIEFGEPISFDEWYAKKAPFLGDEDRHDRWKHLQEFADQLMHEIGQIVPVTPATFLCHALQSIGQKRLESGIDRGTIMLAMRQSLDQFIAQGRRFATDNPYDVEESETVTGMAAADMDIADQLEATLELGLDVTGRRGLLRNYNGIYKTLPGRWPLVQYYANSLEGYDAQTQTASKPN